MQGLYQVGINYSRLLVTLLVTENTHRGAGFHHAQPILVIPGGLFSWPQLGQELLFRPLCLFLSFLRPFPRTSMSNALFVKYPSNAWGQQVQRKKTKSMMRISTDHPNYLLRYYTLRHCTVYTLAIKHLICRCAQDTWTLYAPSSRCAYHRPTEPHADAEILLKNISEFSDLVDISTLGAGNYGY